MKKTYIKPETTTVILRSASNLLTTSNVEVGGSYSSGDAVLSRKSSFWEDDYED